MTRSIYPVSEKILWKEYRAPAPATRTALDKALSD